MRGSRDSARIQAHDDLDATVYHLLHQNPEHLGIRRMTRRIAHNVGIGLPHFDVALHAQSDHTSLGLVGNVRGFHFQHHRITNATSRCQRLIDRRRTFLPDPRHFPMRQEAPRLIFQRLLLVGIVEIHAFISRRNPGFTILHACCNTASDP